MRRAEETDSGAGVEAAGATLIADMAAAAAAAESATPPASLRWVYNPSSGLLLFPAALAALAADAEGRWEAPLSLMSPVLGAAAEAAAVQRLVRAREGRADTVD